MSISSSMYTGLSSLFCLGEKMGALGDNIANIDTTGFKASEVSFEDIYFETLNTGGVRLGSGGIKSNFSESGSIQSSHIVTHMAISGDGLFILNDPEEADATYYTRAGEFTFDYEGYLVNPGGYVVQGYEFASDGTEGTSLADIQLTLTTPDATEYDPEPAPRLLSSPIASTRLTLLSNLDARSGDNSSAPGGLFDKWDATSETPISLNAYEHQAEHYIYDSSGDTHAIAVYFDYDTIQDNKWEYLVVEPPDGTATSATDGVLATGTITFTNDGKIQDMDIENYPGGSTPLPNSNGYLTFRPSFAGAGPIELDLGARYVNGAWQPDSRTTTQFGYGSYTKFSNTDGYGEGDLLQFSVNTEGIIRANFDNGVISDLFRVGLANTNDPSSRLQRIGRSLYQVKADPLGEGGSEDLTDDIPGSSGLGMIIGSSLETSNVDMAEQFGDLILTQRAFQANAKGMLTADEMLKTLVALKR